MLFQENISLVCRRIQSMADSQILDMLYPDVLDEIKKTDKHPFFQVYSICHEGVSSPKMLEDGNSKEEVIPITWTKKAIQSIKNVIKKGLKFFVKHNKDNSTEGRRSIGKVVGHGEEEIDSKLHSLVVGYFPNREEAEKHDICSQEAIWNFIENAGKVIAETVEDITGIALSNSSIDRPAFAGAKRLGVLQAFSDTLIKPKTGDVTMTYEEIRKNINFDHIKRLKEDMNIHVWQIFNLEDLKTDREFGKFFTENEELKKQLEDKETSFSAEKETLTNEVKKFKRQADMTSVKDRLKELLNQNDEKLTDNLKKFVGDNFNDEMEDLSDDSLKKFIGEQVEVYKKAATYINPKDDINIPTGDNVNNALGDFTKAANNELLSEDYEAE